MKRPTTLRLGSLALAGIVLAGCAAQRATLPEGSSAQAPIWVPVESPRILPPVTILNGGTRPVDVSHCVAGEITSVKVLDVSGGDGIRVSVVKGTQLEVAATKGVEQQGVARLEVRTADGRKRVVGFPVVAQNKPAQHVTFKAPADQPARSVSIAGGFNGWNAAASPLQDHDGDGMWEADVVINPGSWPYKMVVDGQWILDPANPDKVVDGANENSLMVVKGAPAPALAPLGITMVPAGAAGMGGQGGFAVALDGGAALNAEAVQVFVNNVHLAPTEYTVDPRAGTVSLNVAPSLWAPQQFVSISATDTTGRAGYHVAPFDFAESPRSPRDETIYYVVLDRFSNGDVSNDDPVVDDEVHPLNNYMGGDIEGVRQYLRDGYFNELGATTLWISPPYRQPDYALRDSKPPHRKLTGYHGYWPTDLRAVDPRWGSVDQMRELVAEAHERGIAVIIDFVSNHVHADNPMVAQHPDWFNKLHLPDGTPNIRMYDAHPFTTWFDDFLPDIAYDTSPAANNYMVETALWWLEQTNADGFRHDAVKHVPNVFWETCTQVLNERYVKPRNKRIYQVGETVASRAIINQFISPRMLDGQFDFPLFWTIEDTFGWERTDLAGAARSLQESVDQYPIEAIMSPFLGNHDVPRFMGKAEYDNKPGSKAAAEEDSFTNPAHVDDMLSYNKLQLAFAFLMTIPGAPMVYYGDEIGMTGSGRPDARRMFIPPDEWNAENKHTHDVVQQLFLARQNSVALRRGAYQLLSADKEHLVFARIAPEEVAIVAIQRKSADNGQLEVALPKAWGAPRSVETLANNGITDADVAFRSGGKLSIASRPYTAGVWRLKW